MAVGPSVGHSAKVRLSLHVADRIIPLSHVGPDSCVSRQPIDLPPQAAELVVDIDANRHTHRVFLPEGMSAASPTTTIRKVED